MIRFATIKNKSIKKISTFILILLSVLFGGISFVLDIIGAIRFWHPLPFWDMWDGVVNFWFRLGNREYSVWWEQHNEHRILLSNLLFWLDLKTEQGLGTYLIVANIIFMASIAVTLIYAMYRLNNSFSEYKVFFILFAGMIFGISTSWIQYENITWGFQSGFFLAVLLPLISFLLLANYQTLSLTRNSKDWNYWLSFCLSIASVGTMANGILVPWLSAFLSYLFKIDIRKVIYFVMAAVLSTSAYLYNYSTPKQHSSFIDSVLNHPIDLLKYLIVYFGNPIYQLTNQNIVGTVFAGILFLLTLIIYGFHVFLKSNKSSYEIVLFMFLIYLLISAFLTSTGRINFGLGQALSIRYNTPVLAAWATLFVLWTPILLRRFQENLNEIWPIIGFVLVFFSSSWNAPLAENSTIINSKDVSTIALSLSIPDTPYLSLTNPNTVRIMELSEKLKKDKISILGQEPFSSFKTNIMKKSKEINSETTCDGWVDSAVRVNGSEFWRISGWLTSNKPLKTDHRTLELVNENDLVVGYIAIGLMRQDVQNAIGTGRNSGFTGYILKTSPNSKFRFQGLNRICKNSININAEVPL